MGNAFRLKNGTLDRKYLRTCAVYRCLLRYNKPRSWGEAKLSELGINLTVVEIWYKSFAFRDMPDDTK